MEKEQTASRVPIQNVYVKEVYKNKRNTAQPQKVTSFTKKIEKKGEPETVTMKQQQRLRSQNNLSAEKNEEAGVTSQINTNNEGQPGWTKAIDKNRGKSKKSNLALNEVDLQEKIYFPLRQGRASNGWKARPSYLPCKALSLFNEGYGMDRFGRVVVSRLFPMLFQ